MKRVVPPVKGVHEYDPTCPDCLPAFLDVATGRTIAQDDPRMVRALAVWWAAPFIARRAFMRCTNSEKPLVGDIEASEPLVRRMVEALSREEKPEWKD